ncbi:hypothetical protein HDV06_001441 [Boothiomyces sp. JEL0866]|nr:hypothetical protein HDV06_001441 [Boothiomyces sp. JEL0866]
MVMNSTLSSGVSEAACYGDLKKFTLYAYSYDVKNKYCYQYDVRLQNLNIVTNSSSNCGFYLPSSQTCYDDGSNVFCTLHATNVSQPSSNTGLIVGVTVGVIAVIALIAIVLFLLFRARNRKGMQSAPGAYPPPQSASAVIATPTSVSGSSYPSLSYDYAKVPNNDNPNRYSYMTGVDSPATTAVSPNLQYMDKRHSDISYMMATNDPKIVAIEPQGNNYQSMPPNNMYPQPVINQYNSGMSQQSMMSADRIQTISSQYSAQPPVMTGNSVNYPHNGYAYSAVGSNAYVQPPVIEKPPGQNPM